MLVLVLSTVLLTFAAFATIKVGSGKVFVVSSNTLSAGCPPGGDPDCSGCEADCNDDVTDITAVVSVSMGGSGCPQGFCLDPVSAMNGTYTLTNRGGCEWTNVAGHIIVTCISDVWYVGIDEGFAGGIVYEDNAASLNCSNGTHPTGIANMVLGAGICKDVLGCTGSGTITLS